MSGTFRQGCENICQYIITAQEKRSILWIAHCLLQPKNSICVIVPPLLCLCCSTFVVPMIKILCLPINVLCSCSLHLFVVSNWAAARRILENYLIFYFRANIHQFWASWRQKVVSVFGFGRPKTHCFAPQITENGRFSVQKNGTINKVSAKPVWL